MKTYPGEAIYSQVILGGKLLILCYFQIIYAVNSFNLSRLINENKPASRAPTAGKKKILVPIIELIVMSRIAAKRSFFCASSLCWTSSSAIRKENGLFVYKHFLEEEFSSPP